MKNLLVMLLLAPSILFAQSRFDGTWEMKVDTIQFSDSPGEYLLDKGMYHCSTCIPTVDVKADGNDQKVTGQANFDTLSVRVVDSSSVEFTFKKEGRPTFACTETVSPDGNSMVEEFTETPTSRQVTGHATFTRANKGPIGSHALSGLWQMRTVKNVSSIGPTTTYHSTKDGLKVSAGPQNFEAKFDGRDYPVREEPDHTVSLKRVDDDTIEQTEKRGGKIFRITRMTISGDGKSMKVEATDKKAEKGTTMTYTAEKRP